MREVFGMGERDLWTMPLTNISLEDTVKHLSRTEAGTITIIVNHHASRMMAENQNVNKYKSSFNDSLTLPAAHLQPKIAYMVIIIFVTSLVTVCA